MRDLGDLVCFPIAPEICVEVLSPTNSQAEIKEKAALYFDAGAKEVWLCSASGQMTFLSAAQAQLLRTSQLCPQFPAKVEPRQ
jgi:Uma2 family endonuclease